MNIFSVVIILLILLMGVVGLKRGFIKELVVVVGTILVFFLAFFLKDFLATFLWEHLPFFNFASKIGGLSSLSILFYQFISFLLLLTIFRFLLRIIIHLSGLLGKIVDATIILALPHKLLGLILGLVEGYILVFIALNVLAIPLANNQDFMDSKVRNYITYETPLLSKSLGGMNAALKDILSLEGNHPDQNNASVIETLLKYNLVKKSDVEKLLSEGKLGSETEIRAVLEKN